MRAKDFLDTPLVHFSRQDAWTIRDACEGVQIFGAIGSGKTTGSGATIARSFLRAGFGGLVLCAKPEERPLWEGYAKETGREKDVVIFSPDHSWRFNFLDYELRRQGRGGGETENLATLLTGITEIIEGKQSLSNTDQFWERAVKELLRNSIDLLSLSGEALTLQNIYKIIMSAPTIPSDIREPQWQATSYCARSLKRADLQEKTPRQAHDFDMTATYWLNAFANLADRTRTSIIATFTGIADMLLRGTAWELFFSGETNIVPEVAYENGKIIILDLPIQEYQTVGRIVQGIFKLMFQRAILRRDPHVFPRPVFLWADEAQNFISSFDFQYQAVARSARACTAYLTQNINNYYAALGVSGERETQALLGNFQTRIFHANADVATNQFAAETIAQARIYMANTGTTDAPGGGTTSTGASEQLQYKVQPAEFTTLRKGGSPHNYTVESIVFQGGRIWQASRDTYLKVGFKQRV